MKKKKSICKYKKIKIKFIQNIKEVKDKNISLASLVPKKESEVVLLPTGQKSLSIGIGKKKEINNRKLITLTRKIIDLAKQNKIKKLAIDFPEFSFPDLKMNKREIAEILTTNFEMANFEFIEYKTPPEEGWDLVEEITIAGTVDDSIKKGFKIGQIQGEEVNNCRVLANTPGGSMTPEILAERAREAAKGTAVNVKILGSKQIERLKMGGVMGVAKGSKEEPRFIIMEYLPVKREKPVVLVGKGVTFDSGGLNLKTFEGMKGMYADMSGGAAVISTLILAARLKLEKNVVGLIPAVENMPSGTSYRPGDILRTMSGKTVEILNTDAEGRLILADALTYAKRYDPKLVVDIATLTGAAMVALGQRASAVFTRDAEMEGRLRELGEISGDYVWPLPLWEEYEEDIKGTYGDLANTGKTKYGGAITAASFLHQFAKDYPWVHIDIAPRMTTIEGEYLAKGASGAPVRLLAKLIERM